MIGLDGMLESGGDGRSKPAGHSIALYIEPLKKQVFDPNHGEFEFGFAAEAAFLQFGADLWSYYQATMQVHSWVLHEVYYPRSGVA